MKKNLTIILISTILIGCYGSFTLTKKLYNWNKDAGKDKFGKEAIFLTCSILPIYGGAIFLDAIVFNSIEFWSGKNPVVTKRIESGDKVLVMKYYKSKKLRIDIFENNMHKDTLLISKKGNEIEISDQKGNIYKTLPNGDKFDVYKNDKEILFSYSKSEIDKFIN